MDKLRSLHDAVAIEVRDGMSIAMGCALESLIPFAAGHEIIRQKKRNLTLIAPISDMQFDQLIGAGCVFPSPSQGYARCDNDFYFEYHRASRSPEGFAEWLQKWVLGVRDQREFLDRLGPERVQRLRPQKRLLAAAVNFGY